MAPSIIIRKKILLLAFFSIQINSVLIRAAYPISDCCSWHSTECDQPDNSWCHANKDQCENSCTGTWLDSNNGPPTNPPISAPASNPTPTAPVSNPTPTAPTGDGEGCCSINFKTCHHDVGTFCWISEENCVGPCGKYWLPNGPREGCSAQWDTCTKDEDCCSHDDVGAFCYEGFCKAEGWAVKPTPPTTDSPVESPVVGPTNPSSPTNQPVTGSEEYCCTWNFYHCGLSASCNANIFSCHSECGGSWVLKDAPAMQCISKYGECTKKEGSCCGSLECNGTNNYKQCI